MFGLRKNKEKPPTPPKPKWLVYGVIAFVALIVLQVMHTPRNEGEPNPALVPITEALPEAEPYKAALPTGSGIQVNDVEVGSGPVLLCGQNAEVAITANENETSLTFKTGASERLLLSQLVSTMRVGGLRQVEFGKALAGSELAPELQGEITALTLTLNSATPDISALFGEKKLMLELIDTKPGSGVTARCGDVVQTQIALYGSDGALKADLPASFTIGAGQLMLGIEQGIIGMREGGERTLVLPPAWQERLDAKTPAQLTPDLLSLATSNHGTVVAKIRLSTPNP